MNNQTPEDQAFPSLVGADCLQNYSATLPSAQIASRIVLRTSPARRLPPELFCDPPQRADCLQNYSATLPSAKIASRIILRPSPARRLPPELFCDPPQRKDCLQNYSAALPSAQIASRIILRPSPARRLPPLPIILRPSGGPALVGFGYGIYGGRP